MLSACKPEIEGCTDPKALNYDAFATIDAENCIYSPIKDTTNNPSTPVLGCTDTAAANYNPNATQEDGSCQIFGCTNPNAENYNPKANIDDGSCVDARDKFVGDWTVVHDCPFILPISDPQTISYNSNNTDSILFSPFSALGDARGVVNGFDVTIPSQDVTLPFGSLTFDGSGSMNSAKNEIVLFMNYDAGFLGAGSCTLTYTKL